MELLRRLVLAGGLCLSMGLALYTPPLLLDVHAVDFVKEYSQWDQAEWPRSVVRSLLEKPPTLEAFIEQETGGRVAKVQGGTWAAFTSVLQQVAVGSPPASVAGRASRNRLFFVPDESPLDTLMPAVQGSRGAGWLNTHVAVESDRGISYFEILLVTDPRDSRAPAALVYPFRPGSWWWVLTGLAVYAFVFWPRHRRDIVAYDPLGSVIPLDAIGSLWLALCIAIPLWFTDSFSEALGEEFGFTAFFWTLAMLAGFPFVVAARRAAATIQVSDAGFQITSLTGSRMVPIVDVLTSEPLVVRGAATGVVLKMRDGRAITIDWTDRVRFGLILDALARGGLYTPRTAEPDA